MGYSKILLFTFFIFASFFLGKHAFATGSYSDEGVAFYAQKNSAGFAAEGIGFYAYITQVQGTTPVYRFLNTLNGDHFYTVSEYEKNILTNNLQFGYIPEGIAFYAFKTQESGTIPVHRFIRTNNGDHFYTAFKNESDAILNNPQWGLTSEGVAFYTFANNTPGTVPVYRFINTANGNHFYTASESEKNNISQSPVYRFYNPKTGDHFYTASKSEKNIVANTSKSGYLSEGIAFYARTSQTNGTSPVYRFLNITNGDHFYTAYEAEKDSLINNVSSGYIYENIAFYAPTGQLSGYYPVYRFVNSTTGDHFYTVSESEKYALITPPLGPEISVGLWYYSKAAFQNNNFQINANKAYNIRNANGTILAQVSGSSTTRVGYDDDQNQLTVEGSLGETLAGKSVTFDAADGDNSNLIFDTHRSNFVTADYRGKIDNYRGKIKVQYYRGYDIVNGASPGSANVTQIWVNNILPLEQYVWGAAETNGTKSMNHTQVMVTAYRTYGFWYIKYANKYSALGFKIRSDSGSQNYGGYDWEKGHLNVQKAAQNTRGTIATYNGDVALTPYSSASDGRSRSWQEKWGGTSYPWCQSVPDPYGKDLTRSAASHMVGLIGYGSENLAGSYGWDWQRILKYYFTGISLPINY